MNRIFKRLKKKIEPFRKNRIFMSVVLAVCFAVGWVLSSAIIPRPLLDYTAEISFPVKSGNLDNFITALRARLPDADISLSGEHIEVTFQGRDPEKLASGCGDRILAAVDSVNEDIRRRRGDDAPIAVCGENASLSVHSGLDPKLLLLLLTLLAGGAGLWLWTRS